MKNIYLQISSLLVLLIAFGCQIKPFDDVVIHANGSEWAVPLVDTDKTFNDIIDGFDAQALVQIAPDGGVVLKYKGNFIARNSLDIFSQFKNAAFVITDTVMQIPFALPNGVHIDSAFIKSGKLEWIFPVGGAEPLDVTIKIPQLVRNGQIFQRSFVLQAFGARDSLSLIGWSLVPSKDSIFIIHDARKRDAARTRVNLAQSGGFTIQNFDASFLKGFFGKGTFDVERDTIEMDFFNKWKTGSVRFGNPKLIATLDNSFGIPVRAVMRVGQVLTVDGRTLPLISPLSAGVDIAYPSLSEVGKSKKTVVVFDKMTSNLVDIISANPRAIDYEIDGFLNADTTRRVTGFLTDSSKFNLQVELEVPMEGTIQNFTTNDTFSINLADAKEIQQGEFKILTDNRMPIDVVLQGYFATENGQILDSLYTAEQFLLKGAPVGTNGLPIGVSSTENIITLNAAKMGKLREIAKKLIIRYRFSTTNNGSVPVKLLASQGVRVRIGVRFTYKKP